VYLSDVEGVMASGALVHSLDRDAARQMVIDGTISNGMIPKIRSAFDALDAGVRKIHMIDGRAKHSLLLEIFTNEGIGTEVIQ
jgi:acetylglutamate kinase